MPALDLRSSPVRWVIVPRPVAAYDNLPGCFFASAMNSWSDEMPSSGVTVRNIGCSPTNPMDARDLERQIRLQSGQGHEGRRSGHVERITVGGGTGRGTGRDGTAGTRLIEHH